MANENLRCTRNRGFTLLELMITISVAGILLAIALPSLRTFLLNQRRDSTIDALVASLHYTRNQALNLDQVTTLCAGSSGSTCAGGAWSSGWKVMTLPAGSSSVLLTIHALQVQSTTPGLKAVNGQTSFGFTGIGLVPGLKSAANGNEVMVVCDSRGASYARAVEINSAGYIQSSATPGFDPSGSALTCP